MHDDERKRLRLLAAVVALFGILFIGRLYMLQIVHGDEFAKEAVSQYVATVPNLYNRGNIYFETKEGKKVAAATVNSGYLVAIDPKLITDAEGVYKQIAIVIPTLAHDEFISKAGKKQDPYEEVATHVPEAAANELKW